MGKFLMVVTSAPKDGRDDEYNAWYDGRHLSDLLNIPGIKTGKRFDAIPVTPNPQPAPYLAIYEIETDDPAEVLGEMMRRAEAGEMPTSDALDFEQAKIWMYKAH